VSDPLNVIAVVVTHNKLDVLARAVQALRQQTCPPARVIVVDNASTDGTADWLCSQPDLSPLRLPTNTGGAGGFHFGVKEAYAQGTDWIWLLDDDCIARPTALEELLKVARACPEAAFLNSLALWRDGTPCRMNVPPAAWSWTDFVQESEPKFPIASCSFVSCLVNAAYVRGCGFPIKQFFIWCDDFEYTRRLASAGPGYLVPRSVVVHETKENIAVDWTTVNDANVWKFSYGIRNELSIIAHRGRLGLPRAAIRLLEIFAVLHRAHVAKRLQLKLLMDALRGLTWDYRRCIEAPGREGAKTRQAMRHQGEPAWQRDSNEQLTRVGVSAIARQEETRSLRR